MPPEAYVAQPKSCTVDVTIEMLVFHTSNESLRKGGRNYSKNTCAPFEDKARGLARSFLAEGVRPETTNMLLCPAREEWSSPRDYAAAAMAAAESLLGDAASKNTVRRKVGGVRELSRLMSRFFTPPLGSINDSLNAYNLTRSF